jgi:hypothetical protein
MMNHFRTAISLLAAVALSGCHSMKISTEAEKGHNFSAYKSYTWIDAPQPILEQPDTYLNPAITDAIDNELAIKGIKKADNPDLKLVYYVKLKREQGYTSPDDHDDGHDFSGGFTFTKENGWQYKERDPDLYSYGWEVGTLTILMYDASTGERVWRGSLQTEMDRRQSDEKQIERINKIAERLMAHYPPIR